MRVTVADFRLEHRVPLRWNDSVVAAGTRIPQWTAQARERLETQLEALQVRRTARRLTVADVERCADEAVQAPLGFAWRHGGAGGDVRASTTLCLAVVREDQLVIDVAVAHGNPTPASAWSDLGEWNTWDPSLNRAACQRWASRRLRSQPEPLVLELLSSRPSDDDLERRLHAAVLAAPDDNRPRLIYADFLLERGDVRGELIARQCVGDPASDLLEAHGKQWLGVTGPIDATFSRGFVSSVETSEPSALGELESLLEREPVTELSIGNARGFELGRLAARPEIARIQVLRLGRLRSPLPASLVIPRSGLEVLAAIGASRWASLRSLHFDAVGVGDQGLHHLKTLGSQFPRLVELSVETDEVTAAGIAEVLNAGWVTRIQRLSLLDNYLGSSGAETLAATTRLRALTHLSLAGNHLGDAGMEALGRSSLVRGLRVLDVRGNGITRQGLAALLERPHLDSLEVVALEGNPLGAARKEAAARWRNKDAWLTKPPSNRASAR